MVSYLAHPGEREGEYGNADQAFAYEEYQRWLAGKQRLLRNGGMAMGAAVLVIIGALVLAVECPSDETSAAGLLVCIAAVILKLWGASMICIAKGQPAILAVIGLLTLVLGDCNKREAPPEPRKDGEPTGVKPPGSVFSDW